MIVLRWLMRRELIVADAALVAGLGALVAGPLLGLSESSIGSLRVLGVVAAGYGIAWILLFATVSFPSSTEGRLAAAAGLMRVADVSVILPIALIYFASPVGRGFDDPSPIVVGLPAGLVVLAVGLLGLIVGWGWARRIYRGNPEPEANDHFWWSRA